MALFLVVLRRVLKWLPGLLIWGLALGILYFGATYVQVWLASGADDSQEGADAAVVLGAAQYDGEPSPVLAARLDRAFALYEAELVALIVTTGANQPGDRFTQGYAGYDYLREKGVPDENLVVITDGASTYEELAATAVQASHYGITTVLLVSDQYHSFRLRQIAEEVGLDAALAPTAGSVRLTRMGRETLAAGLGRIFGYRRLDAWG